MSLGAPLGLLALLAVPALLGLYFLRRRQPPRVVSALFLWLSPDQRAEAGPRLERFSRELSLLLELLAALAATAYLADLRVGASAVDRHTVVVLDGSLSMSAHLPSGKTVAHEALAQLAKLADSDDGRVTVIESGLRPHLLEGPAAPRARLSTLRYRPRAPAHDLAPALALARELAGPRCRIRLITDAPLEPSPEGVEVIAVGEPLDNDAFVAAARSDHDGLAIVALRVAHFAKARAEVLVELTTEDGKPLHSERLALGPGEEKAVHVEVRYGGAILARLPEDALPEDGSLRLLAQPPRPLKIGVALPDGAAADSLRHFLAADGAATSAEPADLVFADPASKRAAAWTVLLGVTSEPHSLVGPFFADRRHPLLDAVPLEGLLWSAGEPVPGAPLLTSGDAILISEEDGPVFHVNVDLSRSNLHRSAAWPVMLANLFAMRREALPGFARRDLALDEELAVDIDAASHWELQGAETKLPLRGAGILRLSPPGVPGRYTLLKDGVPVDELEVMPIDRRESDLRQRASARMASNLPVGRVSAEQPRSNVPLLLLVLLTCLDWVVTSRATGARKKRQEVPA